MPTTSPGFATPSSLIDHLLSERPKLRIIYSGVGLHLNIDSNIAQSDYSDADRARGCVFQFMTHSSHEANYKLAERVLIRVQSISSRSTVLKQKPQ